MPDPKSSAAALSAASAPAASAVSTTPDAVPDFYQAENYRAEESIGYMMRRITTTLSQLVSMRMCEPSSPTFPQWAPLYKLHMGHAKTVAELARECQLDTGAMTRLLDRLEAKGLCRRERSTDDRRSVSIRLTAKGKKILKAEQARHHAKRDALMNGLTPEERAQAERLLPRLAELMEEL